MAETNQSGFDASLPQAHRCEAENPKTMEESSSQEVQQPSGIKLLIRTPTDLKESSKEDSDTSPPLRPDATEPDTVLQLHFRTESPVSSVRRSNESNNSQLSLIRSGSSQTGGESLKAKLRDAREEVERNSVSFIVPRCQIEALITVDAVKRDIRSTDPFISEEDASKLAHQICHSTRPCKQLYATLASVKKGIDAGPLLAEDVSDEDLPLRRKSDDTWVLERKDNRSIATLEKWSRDKLERFFSKQYWMTTPVFQEHQHYDLDRLTILPFLKLKSPPEIKRGGYSEVFAARIHPSHHDFWKPYTKQDEPLVAVKRLFSPEEEEFEKEKSILLALGVKGKQHKHLIKLLATYKQDDKYHLMFPYADANLRKFWEDRKNPKFDEKTVLWSLTQMVGLSRALLLVHKFTISNPRHMLGVSGAGGKRVQRDAELSVTPKEEKYGRHGDIKPENILWFKASPDTEDPMGILQIADFGLGRFHGRDSRSNLDPNHIVASSTYEPPELQLKTPVSRKYDLWSLGCVFLEFVTWILKGSEQIDGFADHRGLPFSQLTNQLDDDKFFTIIRDQDGDEDKAEVRGAVNTWVAGLHAHEKCSEAIHELLDLIMAELLIVDSKDRISASKLVAQLNKCLQRAKEDKEYLLKAVPRLPEAGTAEISASTPSLPSVFRSARPKNVSFSSPESVPNPSSLHTGPDLVLRNVPTPRISAHERYRST